MNHLDVCREIWRQKAVCDELTERLGRETKRLTGLKMDALKLFEAAQVTKQHLPGLGTISVQEKKSIAVPSTPEQWKIVFEYIEKAKGRDVLDGMVCIHSATFNSFYNAESDAQAEAGNYTWAMPGVGEPKEYKTLGITKERGK